MRRIKTNMSAADSSQRQAHPSIVLGRSNRVRPIQIGGDEPLRIVAPFGWSHPRNLNVDLFETIAVLVEAGVDAVQELSTFGPYVDLRPKLIQSSMVPYGTVLAYEIGQKCGHSRSNTSSDIDRIVRETLDEQIKQGVDYITVHASLSLDLLDRTEQSRRMRAIPFTSRGAAIMLDLMRRIGMDNPLMRNFEAIARCCADARVVLRLGSCLRSGAISDALDKAHREEIREQGKLSLIAQQNGAQIMLEGLSHAIPTDYDVYCRLVEKICPGAVITALGPLPTDVAVGMDHVAAAIGIVFAVQAGVQLCNIVTSKEHLAMPNRMELVSAVRSARIGAHVANVLKEGKSSVRDRMMSQARGQLDWDRQLSLALFPELIEEVISSEQLHAGDSCSICASKCPLVAEHDL